MQPLSSLNYPNFPLFHAFEKSSLPIRRSIFATLLLIAPLWAEGRWCNPFKGDLPAASTPLIATRAAGEMIATQLLFAFTNHSIRNVDYGQISFATMRQNLRDGWMWDQNNFVVNHIGHPYQGSLYYSAARGQGLSFLSASLNTLAGSITWELFMEKEAPSKNDLIATSIGGISFGEILLRLSQHAFARGDQAGAAVGTFLQPMQGVNEALGWAATPPPAPQLSGAIDLGGGTSLGRLDFEGYPSTPQPMKLSPSFHLGFLLEYGEWGGRRPYDHFQIEGALFRLRDSQTLSLFSQGELLSHQKRKGQRFSNVALWLHYDILINEWINLGSNGIGPGVQLKSGRSDHGWEFSLLPHWILIGSSDFLYAKLLDQINIVNSDEERRTYQLSMGEGVKARLRLSHRKIGNATASYNYYGLHTFPGSEPYSGSNGYDIISIVSLRLDRPLTKRWSIATKANFYYKEAFYRSWPNIEEKIGRFLLLTSRKF